MSIDVEVEIEDEVILKRPNLWRIIFHNDNKTTIEFVMFLLMKVFHKTEEEAAVITLEVHEQGSAIAGVFTHEIAENKKEICTNTARSQNFPLKVTIEEEL